ncbi:porin [Brenneria nigrifluens]|uniref:Porin n=2 Tax=Pectobacteriaceae TaxID=1903410 RepID=A0A2U1UUW6_9GAMM|nr:porin [Brenneria nigrifluens] [Brenneria nigrifluens DSM 30175 = ATCC 13028]QCR06931.1 porin [Brenneria nigrifluens] [Brenneria nigrifluens DSM 30175 = ATCC 13028]
MKRNILAVVIPALLAAGAANAAEVYNKDGNKLDLYGRVNAKHYIGGDNSNQGDGDTTHARLGFKGETQINDELIGYGRFEYEFSGSSTESGSGANSKTRFAYAGLKYGDYGSFDYGRNYGIVYDSLAWTDVLPEFGGSGVYTDGLTGRTTGAATYRNSDFFGLVDGLSFGLQYIGKNDRDTAGIGEKANGDGWGTSLTYESDIGVGVTASYGAYDRTNAQSQDNKGPKAEAWATGLKYDANNLYLAATYGQYRNLTRVEAGTGDVYADKTKVFEVVAQYTFDFGLTPSLAFVSSKAKDDQSGNNDYAEKYVSVGATYAFNKNISLWTEYVISLIDDDNDYYSTAGNNRTDDTVAVGLKYQF